MNCKYRDKNNINWQRSVEILPFFYDNSAIIKK